MKALLTLCSIAWIAACGEVSAPVSSPPSESGGREAVASFLVDNGDIGFVRDPDVRLPPPPERHDEPEEPDVPETLDPAPPPPVCSVANDIVIPSSPGGVVVAAAAAARDGGFGFVVAWAVSEGIQTDVRARLLDECGAAEGTDFEVDGSGLVVAGPVATALPGGGFVLAWSREDAVGDREGAGVLFQRYGAEGVPIGGPTLANETVADDQLITSAATTSGGFALAWEDHEGVDARRPDPLLGTFDEGGSAVSGDIVIAPAAEGFEDVPLLGGAADGTVLAVWAEDGLEPLGRRRSALGAWSDAGTLDLAGAAEALATSVAGSATSYAVGVTAFDGDLSGDVDLVLVPAAGGGALTTVSVASVADASESDPVVVPRIGGGWTIAWTDESGVDADDTHGSAVRARRYSAVGVATDGSAFVVPTTILYDQALVAGASGAGGELFVWLDTSRGGDRDGGVRARLVPTAFDPSVDR